MLNKKLFIACLCLLPLFMEGQSKRNKKSKNKNPVAAATAPQQVPVSSDQTSDKIGSVLPSFTIMESDSTVLRDTDIPAGQPVLLVLFNPMCDHCQQVAMAVKEHISEFEGVSIIFLTGINLLPEIKTFKEASNIQSEKRIKVCGGYDEFTRPLFEAKGIPQIMAYDKNRVLKAIYYKEIDIAKTLSSLRN